MFIFGGVLSYFSCAMLSKLTGFVSVSEVANVHISGESFVEYLGGQFDFKCLFTRGQVLVKQSQGVNLSCNDHVHYRLICSLFSGLIVWSIKCQKKKIEPKVTSQITLFV